MLKYRTIILVLWSFLIIQLLIFVMLRTLTFQLRQEFCSLVVLFNLFYKEKCSLNFSFSLVAIKKSSTISLSDGALPWTWTWLGYARGVLALPGINNNELFNVCMCAARSKKKIIKICEKGKGPNRVRTGDLLICSQMLYHWAMDPCCY